MRVKVKVRTLDIEAVRESLPQKRSYTWHVFSRDLTVLSAHPTRSISNENEAIPAFAFPAIAGTHLPTPEGWKAELAWVVGCIVRQFICPKAVTRPATNRARCRATVLIETNVLPLHQTANLK